MLAQFQQRASFMQVIFNIVKMVAPWKLCSHGYWLASTSDEWAANPITAHEEAHTPDLYTEQTRQEQLDFDFDFSLFFNFDVASGVPVRWT
ncbi:Hypothetical predicted protein [Lecanosticta acicola]|uniref:Uncharacterized protein n=1 Tax=Lecanosticta acicola TaxID=111012 RepID=A0AAI8YZA7_9PEZI|nr:Hypothetical predicted protein [Lecanosticta acicola]